MADLTPWRRKLKSALLFNSILTQALSLEAIEAACRALGHEWRDTFWNPTTTLVTFLFQVLSAEKTLRAAVADLLAQLAASPMAEIDGHQQRGTCSAARDADRADGASRQCAQGIS
jgi:hypothetical protein